GFNLGYTQHKSAWEQLYTDYQDYQDTPLFKDSGSITGGAQIGYNWQHCSRVLFGLQADFNKTNAGHFTEHDTQFGRTDPNGPPGNTDWGYITIRDHLSAFATLRARLGIVISDRTLIYGTAGLAFGKIVHEVRDIGHWDGTTPIDRTYNGWQKGWVVGGGFETALNDRISLNGEALWMDFGKKVHYAFDQPVQPAPIDPYVFRHGERNFTARIGLNFKLHREAPHEPYQPMK
ncbi:MAG TPA: outer membrane beta-barrel protein, partial [Hyphomicrobiaceae bacterium]|nr:outer membrane beta-barrel protein [Hyphomicrobiaceae bacterium]